MASAYLRTRTGLASKGAGKRHGKYISGLDKYSHKDEVKYVVDKHIPSFAKDAVDFFDKADKLERANGRSYRSMVFAIPREATDPLAWAQALTDAMLEDKHAYRLAIHLDKDNHNPHAHLMFSERGLTAGMEAKDFFTRANPKEKRISGTAGKRWLEDMKGIYVSHIQKLVPNYVRPNRKEPKIGQAREIRTPSDAAYEAARQGRMKAVKNLRGLEAVLADTNAAIEAEQLRIDGSKKKPLAQLITEAQSATDSSPVMSAVPEVKAGWKPAGTLKGFRPTVPSLIPPRPKPPWA